MNNFHNLNSYLLFFNSKFDILLVITFPHEKLFVHVTIFYFSTHNEDEITAETNMDRLLLGRSHNKYHLSALTTSLALLVLLFFVLLTSVTAIWIIWLELALIDDPWVVQLFQVLILDLLSVFGLLDLNPFLVLQLIPDVVTINCPDMVDNLLPSCPHLICSPFLAIF